MLGLQNALWQQKCVKIFALRPANAIGGLESIYWLGASVTALAMTLISCDLLKRKSSCSVDICTIIFC